MTDIAAAPLRLSVNATRAGVLAVIDSDLAQMKKFGMDLQEDGAVNGSFLELAATDAGLPYGRMHDIVVYRVTLGEIVTMAAAADTETRLWQRRRRGRLFDPAHEMAQRAMAELHAYYLLGAGHALINIVGRYLALDTNLRAELKEAFGTDLPVGRANTNKHTLELSERSVEKLSEVASQASDEHARNYPQPLSDLLEDDAWSALRKHRALDFHRLRPQSHGIAGPQFLSPWVSGPDFARIDISIAHRHADNMGIANERAEVCRSANRTLSLAIEAVDESFQVIRKHLPSMSTPVAEPQSTSLIDGR